MFPDSIAGLPLHPLVVHGPVVLLPLAALGFLVVAFVRRWRAAYSALVALGASAGAAFAIVAKETGESLAEVTKLPVAHERWADLLVAASVGFAVLTWAFWFLQRAGAKARWARFVTPLVVLTAVAALVVLVLTVLTGHSGAQAVWG